MTRAMNDADLASALAAYIGPAAPADIRGRIRSQVLSTPQLDRSPLSLEHVKKMLGQQARQRKRATAAWAILALAAVLVAFAVLRLPAVVPYGNPSASPVPTATSRSTSRPSPGDASCRTAAGPVPAPSGEVAWHEDSRFEDWPGGVRPEAVGDSFDVSTTILGPENRLRYLDEGGEALTDAPWVDLTYIDLQQSFVGTDGVSIRIQLAGGGAAPELDPRQRWIGYGVVIDLDGDGIGDRRVGMDNARTLGTRREWVSDLGTGEVVVNPGGFGYAGLNTWFDTSYAGEGGRTDTARLIVGQGCGQRGLRFYVWASTIEGGHVVNDYLPSRGWINHPPGQP